jgi:hypothetical protein
MGKWGQGSTFDILESKKKIQDLSGFQDLSIDSSLADIKF